MLIYLNNPNVGEIHSDENIRTRIRLVTDEYFDARKKLGEIGFTRNTMHELKLMPKL